MKYIILILLVGLVACKNTTSPKTEVKDPPKLVLEGAYVSKDNPFYKSFTFKGKSTVVIKDAIFGLDFVSSYEKDENFLRIKTDKSDLLLQIVTADSIVGEGFAKGSFVKQKGVGI